MNRRTFLGTGIFTVSTVALEGTLGSPRARAEGRAVPPLEFQYEHHPQYDVLARYLPEVFARLGIELRPQAVALATMLGRMYRQREYGPMAGTAWGATPERLDPDFWLKDIYHSKGGRNFFFYHNPQYDEVADKQRGEVDPTRRKELVWKAQEIIAADQPSIFLSYWKEYFAWNKDAFSPPKPSAGLSADWGNLLNFLQIAPRTNRRTLVVGDYGDFKSMNILSVRSSYESQILRHIYDTLVRYDYAGEPVPWAASAIKWLDPTTIEIQLRPNMKFHDGKPVRPADVKFSFDYLKRWQPALMRFALNYERVEITGDGVLRVTLARPYVPFVRVDLGFIPILPEHIWQRIPEAVGLSDPGDWDVVPAVVGSGPFKFGNFRRGQEVTLQRNPDHFAAPAVDGYVRKEYATLQALMTAMELKEVDVVVRRLNRDTAERLGRRPHIGVGGSPTVRLHYFALDHRKPPMNDLAFRRALDHLVDKEKFVQVAEKDTSIPGGNTPISPALAAWHNPNVTRREFSLEKARAVLKDAGYTWDGAGRLLMPKG